LKYNFPIFSTSIGWRLLRRNLEISFEICEMKNNRISFCGFLKGILQWFDSHFYYVIVKRFLLPMLFMLWDSLKPKFCEVKNVNRPKSLSLLSTLLKNKTHEKLYAVKLSLQMTHLKRNEIYFLSSQYNNFLSSEKKNFNFIFLCGKNTYSLFYLLPGKI
jgi:hypothetical protein